MIIYPAATFSGSVFVPGDKSVTHRALLLASIALGDSELYKPGVGEDNFTTINALRTLGVTILHNDADHITIRGVGLTGLQTPKKAIYCGNSGTTMRLLLGLLAGAGISATLTGDKSLSKRPMNRVILPLQKIGYPIKSAPLVSKPRKKEQNKNVRIKLQIASAQVKSCILLSGLFRKGITEVIEPAVSRDHTERMLRAMGVRCESSFHYLDPTAAFSSDQKPFVRLHPNGILRGCRLEIPGDLSSAAFILAAALLTGNGVTTLNVGTNPTRSGFLSALKRMGASIKHANQRVLSSGEPVADLSTSPCSLTAITIKGAEIPLLIDEIPVLAVLGAASIGRFIVRDAKELRVKESDRIKKTVQLLSKIGCNVEEYDDGFAFDGLGKAFWPGFTIDSGGDHRIALAAAVAGLAASSAVSIIGAKAIAISYPEFAETLTSLNVKVSL